MKRLESFWVICFWLICNVSNAHKIAPVQELINRVLGDNIPVVSLTVKDIKEANYFKYKVVNDTLFIQGSDNVALCRGLYDYVKSNKLGLYSWSGNNMKLPLNLKDCSSKYVESPFLYHYYLNVVTYGYSMPYWDWNRWEKEIDWMALHGVNMPLALVANEAISARVWLKMGLTNEEINEYFVGPAHLPWMRMGNISGIDGPLPEEWHKQQIALQHKILKRMKELDMKPICPAFAGFVPQAFKRIYPNLKITETSWAGAFHNWMLSPEDDLFHTLGKMFIEEWEKEFGKNEYYIADSFNEMEIPFPPKDDVKRYSLLASYGDKVYKSIKDGNKDAVWVMQGWMFGYMRNIWDYKTLEALVSKVPDDKLLLLDLAVDYNKHFWKSQVNWEFYKGFYNKQWVYSVIPNMGGKCGLTGVLDFYANGHLEALHSLNKGKLVGFGMAPEGIENNEVIYELLSDAGWSVNEINIRDWLKNYSICRYGSHTEELEFFWDKMLQSVYGTFTDHPRYKWQFRPNVSTKGSINTNEDFYQGVEMLINVPEELKKSDLFKYDIVQWTSAYVGGKMEILLDMIEQAYLEGDIVKAKKMEQKFESCMLRMDAILGAYPITNLQEWINKARLYGKTTSESDYYERNSRRIVTIWGPPVDDYSARIWSGLIRDYYLPRWLSYFKQKKNGEKFDFNIWERQWVEKTLGLSKLNVPENLIEESISLIKETSSLKETSVLKDRKDILGSWNETDFTNENEFIELSWHISSEKLKNLKGIEFHNERGTIIVSSVTILADGKKVIEFNKQKVIKTFCLYKIENLNEISANNTLELKIKIKGKYDNKLKGYIEGLSKLK